MPLGNTDLKAKICVVPAKYCLLILCVLHVFLFLLVTGAVLYVYFSAPNGTDAADSFLWILAPGVLSLFTGLGALMFCFVRKQLIIVICIIWPIIVFLVAALFYGIFIYHLSYYGLKWKTDAPSSYGPNAYVQNEIPVWNVVAVMIGIFIIPLSCYCCCVLGCMGLRNFEGNGGQSNPKNNQESKQVINNGNGGMDQNQGNMNQQYQNQGTPQQTPQRTPDRTPDRRMEKDHSGHLY